MIRILDEQALEKGAWSENFLTLVENTFSEDGNLIKELGFEYRAEQGAMAMSVAKSLLGDTHLIVEAGTGVGKSLAYLIPAILFARLTKRPCVVATNTISLQEQLLEKDVPAVRDLFSRSPGMNEYADFRCALLVGRANYLCSNRLSRALIGQSDLFENRQRDELQRISEWEQSGPVEGIRQELSPTPMSAVWESVNADSSLCSSKSCQPENCHYRKARSLVDQADVIIVNHSLFFSLMGAGAGPEGEEDGILFPNDFVIFDEAHEMPDVASEHLGVSVSSWSLENFLRRLYNPKKGKGVLAKIARSNDLARIEEAKLAVEDFFQYLHMETLGDRDRVRIRHGHSLPMEIFPPFGKMLRTLVELSDLTEGEVTRLEIKDQAKRAQGYLSALSDVIEQKNKDHVYWIERTGSNNDILHLRSAPLQVAELLREELFGKGSSVVMTSATITRNGKADFFRNEIGVVASEEKVLKSPFDYPSSMNIRILSDAPNPMSGDRAPYLAFLSRSIHQLARSMEGGTLVLFTNYADLKYCYRELRNEWVKLGRSLYAQGEDLPRSELRKRMIEEGDALLLGAESFWKGFDAKGSCLSQVILTRLPFENPNHPLKEARSEYFESQKRNPFREITLPGAIMRFRQGVGRLIRSTTDCGDLIVLDSRILRQGYGKDFIAELPHNSIDRVTVEEIFGDSSELIDNDIDF
ncbi:ATP-dependent DNA helicase [Opitutales bacterium]|nr:ATP-dependent DNA helicase [Opitutales bacterium]